MNGTLALVGSGEYLPPMEPVDRKLIERIGKPPRVACLPTAAGNEGPRSINYWSKLGVDHFTRMGADAEAVAIIDRDTAQDEALAEKVRAANFVYLSGGKPDYLHSVLVGTRAFDAIESVLAEGGVVAGCSAGAMIWGERSTPFPWHQGFGYLPGVVILPHFDEWSGWVVDTIKVVLANNLTMIGVEGDTALVCADGTYTVSGTGGVMLWNHQIKKRYTDGQTLDWKPA